MGLVLAYHSPSIVVLKSLFGLDDFFFVFMRNVIVLASFEYVLSRLGWMQSVVVDSIILSEWKDLLIHFSPPPLHLSLFLYLFLLFGLVCYIALCY